MRTFASKHNVGRMFRPCIAECGSLSLNEAEVHRRLAIVGAVKFSGPGGRALIAAAPRTDKGGAS